MICKNCAIFNESHKYHEFKSLDEAYELKKQRINAEIKKRRDESASELEKSIESDKNAKDKQVCLYFLGLGSILLNFYRFYFFRFTSLIILYLF